MVSRLLLVDMPEQNALAVPRGALLRPNLRRAQDVRGEFSGAGPVERSIIASSHHRIMHHLTMTCAVYEQALRQPGLDSVLRLRIPLPPPTASSLTFSLAMRRRENLRVLRDFPCEALHCRTCKQRRLYSLSAVFLSTSGLREFGTDFLCS